jgi:hypothetical protein
MTSAWGVVLGAGISIVVSTITSYLTTRIGRAERKRETLTELYDGWITAIVNAADTAEDAQREPSEQHELAAEVALDAVVPYAVRLVVGGAPRAISVAADEMGRFIRAVRRGDESWTEIRHKLEPTLELIRSAS